MAASNVSRITKELEEFRKDPPKNITAGPIDPSNLSVWKAVIIGPEGSPYAGGFFQIDIILSSDYPYKAPNMVFKTKIYHCNINSFGAICLDILKGNWSPAITINSALISVSSLLTEPNPDDPYVIEIANHLRSDRSAHDEEAKRWTKEFARPDCIN